MENRAPGALMARADHRRTPPAIRIGGITPFTTVDFPGRLAAVIFCQGCPWRCAYCHNPHLQPFRRPAARAIAWADVVEFLAARCGLLDAVVFSGGEPTWQEGLGDAMREVREMGFAVGLHTAGPDPGRLRAILPLVDWVGLDIKAPFDARYDRVTGRVGVAPRVRESLRLVLESGLSHELRTTVDPSFLDAGALDEMDDALKRAGAKPSKRQPCRVPVSVIAD